MSSDRRCRDSAALAARDPGHCAWRMPRLPRLRQQDRTERDRTAEVGRAARRRPVDDAGEELCVDALQRAHGDQRGRMSASFRSPSPSRPA